MKFKNKQKTQETTTVSTPKVMTESQLQEHQKNLRDQLVEAQTKVVMIQGAIQMVDLQIKELDGTSEQTKNGA